MIGDTNFIAPSDYSTVDCFSGTENESVSDFALTKQDFPPCKFARVKSYTSESSSPLIS